MFGDDAEVEPAAFAGPLPPAYAPRAFPVLAAAPCPECQQCVAVEAVKKPVFRIHVDTANGHCCMESSNGEASMKGTADRIIMRNGSLDLVGHVRIHTVSSDSESDIASEKLTIKVADLEIQIGD